MGQPRPYGKPGQLMQAGQPQIILMGDAARTLIFDDEGPAQAAADSPSGYQEVLVGDNVLRVSPESSGANEILVLPLERRCQGMPLYIQNTGGQAILAYSSDTTSGLAGTLVATIQAGHFAHLVCNGQAWQAYVNASLIEGAYDTRTGPGAISLTTRLTQLVTTGADALTLAAGTIGQHKRIVMITDGGDGTLTPNAMVGANTTITFNDAGDCVDLEYVGAEGWAVFSNQGCTLA